MPNKLFKRDSQRLDFWFQFVCCDYGGNFRLCGSVAHPLTGCYATQVNLGAQTFGISPAIRFVLSANELFYPQILG